MESESLYITRGKGEANASESSNQLTEQSRGEVVSYWVVQHNSQPESVAQCSRQAVKLGALHRPCREAVSVLIV